MSSHDVVVIISIVLGCVCYCILMCWMFGAFKTKDQHRNKES